VHIAERGEIREDVVGSLRRLAAEAGVHERRVEHVAALRVVAGKSGVVVVAEELEPGSDAFLERRGRPDGEEAVPLPDPRGEARRSDDRADAPAGDAERLGEPAE